MPEDRSSADRRDGDVTRVVGVDVGGTLTKVVAVADGRVEREAVLPTPRDVADDIGAHVAAAVTEVGLPAAAVGVVVPGLVDERAGVGVWSANLGWSDLPVRAQVERAVGRPVAFGHDVRAGLLAEHRLGAARGSDNVLFLPVGTGIAAALLVGGRVAAGSPWTGELGHVVVQPDGPRCGCGGRGCLEAVASAAALGRRWREVSGRDGDARTVAEGYAAGEAVASRLWEETVDVLGRVLAPACATAGTDLVLLGGGLANAGHLLTGPLTTTLRGLLAGGVPHLALARLGDRAAALGAAEMAADLLASRGGRAR